MIENMNNNKLYNLIHKIMNQLFDEIQRAIKNTVLDNSVGVAFSSFGSHAFSEIFGSISKTSLLSINL